TGHGVLREPNSIASYGALAAIAIQANQNDQHGGQSIPTFDYCMAEGVRKTYRKLYARNFAKAVRLLAPDYPASSDDIYESIKKIWTEKEQSPSLDGNPAYDELEAGLFDFDAELYEKIRLFAREYAATETDRATYQAMEALIHNLNTMHSRAGAQVPFSSLNYGTDTSSEGRMVMRNLLLATQAGLGNGETPIYPIQIFKVKDGVSANPGDPNYDLFRLAMKTSAKRLFPNFSFIDAPFNLQYYKPGHPETEVAYMGCRTRVIGNVYDPSREIVTGRGNLSFTSINLPRIAIKANHNIEWFFEELERKMELCCKQLLDRFKIQCSKKVRNFRFLMGQGVWIDSDKLGLDDSVAEVLKHGTLSVGFIGLAETLVALTGHHHGESEEAQRLGIDIVSFMRDFMDRKAQEYKLNFSLLATPAEGLSGRFVRMDKKKFGIIPGVTDREYYTNSFHVPVYYPISAYEKIHLEAPYHALTNAGHITYVELDGAAANNIEAFERVIRTMYNEGIGYGSVNHPVDRDPVCGYNGIIGDECPNCGRHEGDGDPNFERIRRITGYLVGTLENFNDAKRAEERDRVKHNA
ncbi:MAG: anaerobic ribonucleoside triphosphate reductase, partial [Eubacteriales bacterium]|nr:anaerobic ribonucleoside triphosphate reductase [Eubacteriales bacterium]